MDEINKKELKVGDWATTGKIFDFLTGKGELGSRRSILRIEEIIYDIKDGKERKTYKVKCWVDWAGDIKEGALPEKIDILYPLSKEDKRRIILASLK